MQADNQTMQFGKKADNLFLLAANGFQVPRFFVIPTPHMKLALEPILPLLATILTEIQAETCTLATAMVKIDQLFETITVPEVITTEITTQLAQQFGPEGMTKTFSVRSSGVLEDAKEQSFAGQFSSFLHVKSTELETYVKACWRSAFAQNVLQYVTTEQLDVQRLLMGVIIQEMKVGSGAGVLFTQNPRGIQNELVLVYGQGTGDLIVEDKIATNTYHINRNDKQQYVDIQDETALLSSVSLTQFFELGEKIEQVFGYPADIEYVLADDQIYVLQVRPITTLPQAPVTILDNSNITESYPGVSLPLTQSFAEKIYRGVFTSLASRATPYHDVVASQQPVFDHMVQALNGILYYRITNWYTLLSFLPFRKRIIPIWQNMLGVQNKAVAYQEIKLSPWRRFRSMLHLFGNCLGIPKKMERLNQQFQTTRQNVERVLGIQADATQLLSAYQRLETDLFATWDITLLNDLYAFVFTGALEKVIGTAGNSDQVNHYISNITQIESLKPVAAIEQLARMVQADPVIATTVNKALEIQDIKILEQVPAFYQQVINFIHEYGDRSIAELKLESATFRTNPLLLLQTIVQVDHALDMKKEQQQPLTQVTWWRRPLVNFMSKKAQTGILHREVSRLNRTRIFGMVRSIYLEIAALWQAEGLLETQQDIFYLFEQEIHDHILGKQVQTATTLQALIATRKQEIAVYQTYPNFSRLVFYGEPFSWPIHAVNKVTAKKTANEFYGVASSNGLVTGEVVVITDPTKIQDVRGKIIVTEMTDPGWVFLLLQAKGIIAEKGSILSHTAIVSRELGIPAVVGVADILDILEDGDLVEVDGTKGVIKRVRNTNEG